MRRIAALTIPAMTLAVALTAPLSLANAADEQTAAPAPDQAAAACEARTLDAITQKGGLEPKPLQGFATETLNEAVVKATGLFEVTFEGEPHLVAVECDVATSGVSSFTMVIEDLDA